MRVLTTIVVGLLLLAASPASARQAAPQGTGRVVDRIVAHVEGDILLLSQVRELGSFQQLVEGRAESDDRLLAELIEQWIVQTEATESSFPRPAQSEIDRELTRLAAQFGSADSYAAKLREVDVSAAQVRQLLARQIYVARYIDYKFRPLVQIKSEDVQNYFQNELGPQLAKKNQIAPNQADVEGEIRELLTQRAITDLATKWLDETKSRLKIVITLPAGKS
jgi:hypothetical protein